MKEVNRELYNLDVQSYEASTKPGVLATIGGKFSTSAVPSRNDREYVPELWRSVVGSERVTEMLDTKTFYGELSHPPRAAEFLSEVQMNNISHNITKLTFDESTQNLNGTIDILDTPSGQIANTLVKYGSKLGISSRGIVMDDNKYNTSSNKMTPDNYYLVTFDLVALPGIMGARLGPVTESYAPHAALESLSELKHSIDEAKTKKDKQSVKVLKAVVESIKSTDLSDDPEVKKAIQDLSRRPTTKVEDKTVEPDIDVIDNDAVDAAVLEGSESAGFKQMKDQFAIAEDGTYDLVTGQPVNFSTGYQVSFERPDDTYTPEQYDRLIADLIAETGSSPFLGVYGSKEISFHVEDLDLAMEIARRFNQDAVWDWAAQDVVMLDKPAVDMANEDDAGITQASDIEGPVSTINVFNAQDDVKKFLESFEGLNTIEDVAKYVEAMDGVEKKDGVVIINKDTVLFNTMLSMINSMRLRSDANPLLQPGVSIKQLDELEVSTEDEPEVEQKKSDKPAVTAQDLKKHIEKSPTHKTSLEAAFKVMDKANTKLQAALERAAIQEAITKQAQHDNEVLRTKIATNYSAYTESISKRDKAIKELSSKVAEAEKSRRMAANEAVNTVRSSKALEAANGNLKASLESTTRELTALKDKYAQETAYQSQTRKDRKINRLLEAQSFTVSARSTDEDAIRTASEAAQWSGEVLLPTDDERLNKIVSQTVSKRIKRTNGGNL